MRIRPSTSAHPVSPGLVKTVAEDNEGDVGPLHLPTLAGGMQKTRSHFRSTWALSYSSSHASLFLTQSLICSHRVTRRACAEVFTQRE